MSTMSRHELKYTDSWLSLIPFSENQTICYAKGYAYGFCFAIAWFLFIFIFDILSSLVILRDEAFYFF